MCQIISVRHVKKVTHGAVLVIKAHLCICIIIESDYSATPPKFGQYCTLDCIFTYES